MKYSIYFGLLLIAFVLGIRKWPHLHRAEKIFTILLGLTIVQETVAFICDKVFKNNMFTYHFYSPLEFLLICLYFNERSALLKRSNWGLVIGLIGVLVSIGNTWFFQPMKSFNSYYLLFEGTFIILLCLLSLCEILMEELMNFTRQVFFWTSLILMFYWSVTYTGWGIFAILEPRKSPILVICENVLYFSNLLFYISICLIFINYKKLVRPV